jgi:hypothetical protein
MAQKGTNTIVTETRKEIADSINNGLKKLPISVVAMIVENALVELNQGLTDALANEGKVYQEQVQVEAEQVEYVPESNFTDA